jgi:hypothetical protein
LAVIESNRLDPRISIERQGKTSRRILAAGKQDERPRRCSSHRAAPVRPGGSGNATPAWRLAMCPRGPAKIPPPECPAPGKWQELELPFARDSWQGPSEYGGPDNHCASACCSTKRAQCSVEARAGCLPNLLSHVREEPHSIRVFVRVQGIDKNSGVVGDFMQSLPTAPAMERDRGK